MGEVLSLPNTFETLTCGECGVVFAVLQNYVRGLRRSHATWYCPNGHSRWFPEKSDVEVLKEQLAEKDRFIENAKKRREWAEEDAKRARRSASAYKGKLTHVKSRVASGTCPCCKKSFKVLAKHMAAKHPDYESEE